MSVFSITCFRIDLKAIGLPTAPLLSDAPFDRPAAELRSALSHGLRILKANAKNPFHLLQDLQDTCVFYFIGKWPNAEAFLAFSKTSERSTLIDILAGLGTATEWRGLYAFLPASRADFALLPFKHRPHEIMQAPVMGITRHNVAPEDVETFKEELGKGRSALEKFSDHKSASGIRIPFEGEDAVTSSLDPAGKPPGQHDEREECVVLSGWVSVERFNQFSTTEEYREYAAIRGWTKWFERRMAKVIVLE